MDSLRDGIKEALIGIWSEVDNDVGPWGNCPCHFNIQVNFAVCAIWGSDRVIVSPIDRQTGDLRQREVQLVKVRLEVIKLVAAAKFDERYTLTTPIKRGGKVVELGKLWWSIGSRDSTRLKRTGCGS